MIFISFVFLINLHLCVSIDIHDYCNITSCDALEICRREIDHKRFIASEEQNDLRLIKLERRLRSLEQPGKILSS